MIDRIYKVVSSAIEEGKAIPEGMQNYRRIYDYVQKDIVIKKNDNGLISMDKIGTESDPDMRKALFMLGGINRSAFIKNMKLDPRNSSMVPTIMYICKEKFGIKYEQWDKEDPKIEYALGTFLKGLKEMPKEGIEEFENIYYPTVEEINKYRVIMLTTKSTGAQEKPTGFKNNLYLHSRSDYKGVPRCANYMFMQTWLANGQLRVEDAMILDPYNWDNVPKEVDGLKKVEPTGIKLPWA